MPEVLRTAEPLGRSSARREMSRRPCSKRPGDLEFVLGPSATARSTPLKELGRRADSPVEDLFFAGSFNVFHSAQGKGQTDMASLGKQESPSTNRLNSPRIAASAQRIATCTEREPHCGGQSCLSCCREPNESQRGGERTGAHGTSTGYKEYSY